MYFFGMVKKMSKKQYQWLPSLMECSNLANWQEYEDKLYKVYTNDLRTNPPKYFGKPVITSYYPPYKNKAGFFWHLTHEGKIESERTPDIERCERLIWIKPVIEHASELQHYSKDTQKGVKEYLWLDEEEYLVILKPRGNIYVLITAFHVDYYKSVERYRREIMLLSAKK